eukprot:286514-Rhodomonas_salina.1
MVLRIRADSHADAPTLDGAAQREEGGARSLREGAEAGSGGVMPGRLAGGEAALYALALGSTLLILPELLRVVSALTPH